MVNNLVINPTKPASTTVKGQEQAPSFGASRTPIPYHEKKDYNELASVIRKLARSRGN